jgi:TonB family protein
MTPFLLYIGRSSLYLALFYAFFLLAMRRTTFFRMNRALLLAGTLVCFLLPLLRVRTVMVTAPQIVLGPLAEVSVSSDLDGPSAASPVPYLELLYAAGFLAVLAWAVTAYVRMRRTIRKGTVVPQEEGTKLVLMDSDIPSFSWARTVVISRKDLEENPAMLLHEQAHIRKGHTVDTLWFLGVVLLHWFNPLVWIALSELKLLHEYEADETVLDKGIDATQYQLLLVRKAVGDKRFTLANGFQHANLKNRIDMMLKTPSSAWRRLAWLAILPFLAGAMFLVNPVRAKAVPVSDDMLADAPEILPEMVAQTPDTTGIVPFANIDPEFKPMFNGGPDIEFAKWVNAHLVYPATAKKEGAQGRLVMQFVIHPDGIVRDVKVIRGVHPDLDAEAVRVVSSSPDWKPGYVNGKPVKVSYVLPIVFQLKGGEKKDAQAAPQDTSKALPFNMLEVKPTFNGGSAGDFSLWVNENLKYPKSAYEAGAQGRVTLQFTIGKDGNVGDVKVLRGCHPDLDAEAIRVVSSSPAWTPGYVKGQPVKVTYTFPVIFQLRDKSKDSASQAENAPQNATIQIRGAAADSVLFVLDGKEGVKMSEIDPNTIESMQVLKGEQAITKYGEKGRYGVIEITSKKQD